MNLRLARKKSEKDPERRWGERIQREDTGGRGGAPFQRSNNERNEMMNTKLCKS